jgi:hypothetical protein
MGNEMAIDDYPLIVTALCTLSLFFGAFILRWAISGLMRGKIRYRFKEYDRVRNPLGFWFAMIWGFCAGVFFLLGGLTLFYARIMI